MLCDENELIDCSEALAFIGNSLLSPMRQTGAMGVDPAFWDAFPDFGDDAVREAIASCREYAVSAQELERGGGDPVQRASVEYTKLFIGPPRPAAAPWETFYRSGGDEVTVGFGQATFEMQELLRNAGLEVSNENNQYADHMGIELLLLSVLLERAASGETAFEEATNFANVHPASWIGLFSDKVSKAAPKGYFAPLLALASSLLGTLSR
ncbi:MAG: molecular chaperone TorD family protein [Eggerthellaceae bacterium]|nr:molecular chaperone TorD family protein [Eggerthellaceae bacterium]